MNDIIAVVFGIAVTPWKVVGYLGVVLFAGRWVVQVIATRARGRPVIPTSFWLMSVSGSAMLLAYFIWGKNDSVGVLSNLFPMAVAVYNLMLDLRARREDAMRDSVQGHAAGR
ncbi:lipid-A-disaccharide synthase N-terminal domain-containing protein [Povalibacter sp.]|uniref:lipid-A-disaccharide synthase N-terminal domain-containing protein n=1 Tax=Povalibacter sp. TaxID=1962978 RepID=UPI002F405943